MVFVAKKFITMDPGWPEATAVAVQNGSILSVGSLDDPSRGSTSSRTISTSVLPTG
jgi:predicted amidohydrolase YtcJ